MLAGLLLPRLEMLAVFGFCPLLLSAAQSRGQVAVVLSKPLMIFFGKISYSIYLLHWILLQVSHQLQAFLHVHGAKALLWFGGYFAVVIGISTITYYLIEVPARRLLRSKSQVRLALPTALPSI